MVYIIEDSSGGYVSNGVPRNVKKGDIVVTISSGKILEARKDSILGETDWDETWKILTETGTMTKDTKIARKVFSGRIIDETDGYLIVRKD